MTLISNSATGRFSTDVVEVMDHIRKPVFVDNAIHHAISKIRIDDKIEIEIEKSNSINFQVTNEKNYLLVESSL